MQKQYMVDDYTVIEDKDSEYLSLEKRIVEAKKRAQKYQCDYGVFELVHVVKYPIPEYEVVKVS